MDDQRNKGKPENGYGTDSNGVRYPLTDAGKHPGGKPRRWNDPQELDNLLMDYMRSCDNDTNPPTISGIWVALDIPKTVYYEYRERPEYAESFKKVEAHIENWLERKLITTKNNPTGVIFALKNRCQWKDVQTIENTEDRRDEKELMASFTALIHQLAPILVSNQQPPIKVIEATSTPQIDTDTIRNLDDYRKE